MLMDPAAGYKQEIRDLSVLDLNIFLDDDYN